MTDAVLRRLGRLPIIVALTLGAVGCAESPSGTGNAAAKEQARALLLDAKRLPGDYRVARGQQYPGELQVCGVRLEPRDVRGFAMKRYTRSVVGPFLYQFVYVASQAAGRDLIYQVERTLETCSEERVTTDEGTTRYEVTGLPKLPSYGRASVGFRLDPRQKGLTSEHMLIQRGDILLVLFTVAPEGISPPRDLLTAGADAAARQLAERGPGE